MTGFTIPDDLAAQAAQVPGLERRVAQYIKLEVIQHQQRQQRYRPETLALVERARQKAAERAANGFDAAEVAYLLDQLLKEHANNPAEVRSTEEVTRGILELKKRLAARGA